jgi:hypothetical protein
MYKVTLAFAAAMFMTGAALAEESGSSGDSNSGGTWTQPQQQGPQLGQQPSNDSSYPGVNNSDRGQDSLIGSKASTQGGSRVSNE